MNLKSKLTCAFLGAIWAVSALGVSVDRSELVAALDTSISKGDQEGLGRLLTSNFHPHGYTDDLFRKPLTRDMFIDQLMRMSKTFSNFSRTSEIITSDAESLSLRVTETGVQSGAYLSQPPSGNALAVQTLEVWKLDENGKLTEVWRQSDDLATLRQITSWQPDRVLPVKASAARELAHFPPGVFLESIVADIAGNLYFTQLMTGLIRMLAPDGTLSTFAELPVGSQDGLPQGVMCLVLDEEEGMFATVMAPGKPEHGVWRIDQEGHAEHFASLPDEVLPNGIARDSAGSLYVADSGLGGIWKIEPELRIATLWYDGDLLKRRPYIGVYPPANGIQYWNGSLYAANSDRALIVRIPVEDGLAGASVIHAEGVGGDDFAIDEDGTLFVTTHPYNSVIRVDQDGTRTVIAGVEQGMVGPTAATFAHRAGTRRLFVVTDGGLFSPLPDRPLRPALVELNLSGL
jgi:sugar lactone lactonase YvrE/predicted ester cyclase